MQGIIDEISPSPLPFPQREVGENGLFEPFLYIETIVLVCLDRPGTLKKRGNAETSSRFFSALQVSTEMGGMMSFGLQVREPAF